MKIKTKVLILKIPIYELDDDNNLIPMSDDDIVEAVADILEETSDLYSGYVYDSMVTEEEIEIDVEED